MSPPLVLSYVVLAYQYGVPVLLAKEPHKGDGPR